MDLGKILEDFLDDAKTDRAERERAATRNEIFYSGEHAEAESFGGGSYLWNRSNLRPLSYNHISTVVDAFSARLLRNNPFPTSYPISGSPEDQVASQITNAIISQRVRAEDYDDLVHRVVRQGTIHGCAGFKVVYNPEKDLVEWLPLTLFDLYLDPYAETEAEAGWVIFERHIAKPEAQRLLEAAGIKAEPEEENFRKTGSGRSQAGCPLRELWLLPGVHPEFPQGLFAQFVGTEPVQAQDFPYFLTNAETGQEEPFLPLALFSPRATRGSAYGSTPTDNAIEPQKRLNKLEATLANLEELTGNVKLKTSARLAKV